MSKNQYPSLIDTAKLQAAKKKLDEASEQVNATIAHAEAKLRANNPGVAVWIESRHALIPPSEDPRMDDEANRGWQIGFIKIKGEWKLAVRQVEEEDCDCWKQLTDPIALDKAPRIIRMEARYLFNALVLEIVQRAELYTSDIEMGASRLLRDQEERSL